MKTCGIYKILNKINGKLYIGQSVEIERRWTRHKRDLNGFKHRNKHLERAWHKYGKENFTHEIIEICEREMLDEREQFWVSYFSSNDYEYGHNQDSGGKKGRELNEDIKEKIGISRIYATGSDLTNSSLTYEQVVDVKRRILEGEHFKSIAMSLGVDVHTIYNVGALKSYVNEGVEYNDKIVNIKPSKKKFSYSDDVVERIYPIKEYLATGDIKNLCDCANKFNVKYDCVFKIIKMRHYFNIGVEFNNEIINRYAELEKLKTSDIMNIKVILCSDTNITNKELGLKYNIDPSAISNIKLLKSYVDIAPEYNNKLKEIYSNFKKGTIMTEDMVIEIKKKLLEDKIYINKELGEMFGIDGSQISRIKNMKIYTEWGSEYNDMIIEKYNRKINKEAIK